MKSHSTIARIILFFVLLLNPSFGTFAQNPTEPALLKVFEQAETIYAEASELMNRGISEDSTALKSAAVPKFEKAFGLYEQSGAKIQAGACLMQIGYIYDLNKEDRKAIESYERALIFYRRIGDKSRETSILRKLGELAFKLKDYPNVLKYYTEVLPLLAGDENKSDQASVLTYIAVTHAWLGENRQGIEFYERALALHRQLGEQEKEAWALAEISRAYSAIDDIPNSMAFGEEALKLFRKLGNKYGETRQLTDLGRIFHRLGNYKKALELFDSALALVKGLGDKALEAEVFQGLGKVYRDSGEYQRALEFIEKGLVIRKQLADKYGEAAARSDLAQVLTVLGEYGKALESFERAIELNRELGFETAEATDLSNIGTVYSIIGNYKKALEYYDRAIVLRRRLVDKAGEAGTLYGLGAVYVSLGENQKAIDNFTQALTIFRQIGDKSGEAFALSALGAALREIGKMAEAIEYFNRALPLRRQVGDQRGVALTYGSLLITLGKLNKRKFAVFYGKLAANIYQEVRGKIAGLDRETQKNYLKSVEKEYRQLAATLMADGRLAEAQQVLNAFKDQQFFDADQTSSPKIAPLALTPRETDFFNRYRKALDQISESAERLEELKLRLGRRSPDASEKIQLERLTDQLNTASVEFSELLKTAEIEFSKTADEKDRIGEIADTAQMQSALQILNRQTGQSAVAVYTLVAEDNFRALIVTEKELKTVSSPVKASALNLMAIQLWRLLKTPKYEPQGLAKEVYTAIFAPLESHLPSDTKTILWSLDGNLRYLPMAALHDGRTYLAERFQNVIFTRGDKERFVRNVSPQFSGVGFGSSQAHQVKLGERVLNAVALPGVKVELAGIFKNQNSVGGTVTGEVLIDAEFNRKTFLTSLQKRRPFVHIASHFKFEPGDDSKSFLLLGDGTPFTLADLKKQNELFGGVDLLTLSACETAAQRPDANGREIDGFAELAQRQGATAVMASLWLADDISTAELMRQFYAGYKPSVGVNKAKSLQTAQITLLKGKYQTGVSAERILTHGEADEESIKIPPEKLIPFKPDPQAPFAHPFYWAQFILIGNWK